MTLRQLTCLIVMLVSFLSLLAVITIAKGFGFSPANLHNPDSILSLGTRLTVFGILISPIFIVIVAQKYIHKSDLHSLGVFASPALKPAVYWAGIGFAAKLIALISAFSFSTDAEVTFATSNILFHNLAPFFAWYFLTLVLNSFNEELVYRAYPLNHLKGLFGLSTFGIILLSAAFFSAMHFLIEPVDVLRFLYRLGFGISAGILYTRQRHIWGAFGLHTGWNFGALSFSDSDWRTGVLVNISGLVDGSELIANIASLAALSAGIWMYYSRRQSAEKLELR